MKQALGIVAFLVLMVGCSCKPKPKLLGEQACKDGETRTGFISAQNEPNFPCATDTQTCAGGKWSGTQLYDRCETIKH